MPRAPLWFIINRTVTVWSRGSSNVFSVSKLFTIGQFAKIHGINKKTLMWYDEIGLLRPAVIKEKKVFNVAGNYLIACFDSDITDDTVTAIAKQKPYYFVIRDSSLTDDSVATNFDQIFATYSPGTVRKVL